MKLQLMASNIKKIYHPPGAIGDSRDSFRNVVNMENGEIKVENVDTSIKDDSQLTIGQIQKGLE